MMNVINDRQCSTPSGYIKALAKMGSICNLQHAEIFDSNAFNSIPYSNQFGVVLQKRMGHEVESSSLKTRAFYLFI